MAFEYNIVVIGAGAGGLVSSLIGSALKAKVALIEKDEMGGDCLNTGCVPSKALIKGLFFIAKASALPMTMQLVTIKPTNTDNVLLLS